MKTNEIEIEIIEPRHSSSLYKARALEAVMLYERNRSYNSRKQLIDVLAGLCSIAYKKGYHYGVLDAKTLKGKEE